jgi:hypothetical protein
LISLVFFAGFAPSRETIRVESRVEPAAPDANRLLRAASAILAASVPALSHINPARILFVFNPYMTPRARVFPLAFDATGTRVSRDGMRRRPLVRFRGRRMKYVIEYGSAFLAASPERRLRTLVHEILHISPFFNGTLSRSMRHAVSGRRQYEMLVRAAVDCVAAAGGEAGLWGTDRERGLVVLEWRRPFLLAGGGVWTEKDLRRVKIGRRGALFRKKAGCFTQSRQARKEDD